MQRRMSMLSSWSVWTRAHHRERVEPGHLDGGRPVLQDGRCVNVHFLAFARAAHCAYGNIKVESLLSAWLQSWVPASRNKISTVCFVWGERLALFKHQSAKCLRVIVSWLGSTTSWAQSAKRLPTPSVNADYVRAMFTADKFLDDWKTRNTQKGLAILSSALKKFLSLVTESDRANPFSFNFEFLWHCHSSLNCWALLHCLHPTLQIWVVIQC